MAEQIISPGVFTRENDLSFLPQGIGQIGAAIVGPTEVSQNTKECLVVLVQKLTFLKQ